MSLKPEQVRKVAFLARLRLDEDRVPEYANELSGILGLVDQLERADTDGVEPMAHPLDLAARLRVDAVSEGDQRDAFQAIAPATEGGLYLVPRVIE
ncbi:Asp-tRNA(Asn)/Glu-tRNA(Gln) amidotransferase subunit GatC [Salinisphaera sp. P385]|uniref:Aspartyl/glutamyl-tRNA(Asn/Gln) amidotransferase subunit C n=1 Tax=Spectribacter acetivorans TaxID=3075603 RepID=A0ABU3BAM6_9GAMM|nr:Asp-tRNA(Asn)/Glu-tRNA(Gln) amidotransferase subunit GatC [Salinisphaera sp. P385]MDT0619100.1 Asp-tRNA(Asn)/Glu-tRNA(Gln) amidotransferase subunit GatC [Salinisphaera sp. P385]